MNVIKEVNMKSTAEALKIISIQHELCMHIGTGLELESMLQTFLERMQKRLSLSSVHIVWNLTVHNFKAYSSKSFPQSQHEIDDELQRKMFAFTVQSSPSECYLHEKNVHYYLFKVPNFGVLLCKRLQCSIDSRIVSALSSLMPKLATASLACMQHESLIYEVKERQKMQEKLIAQSLMDPLTSLPNKNQFNVNLESAIATALSSGEFGAIFYIDLDRFKVINDSLGHSVGDDILREISSRLKSCFSSPHTIARIGGDEFAVIAQALGRDQESAKEQAKVMAENLSAKIGEPIRMSGNELMMTISTGINIFPLSNLASQSLDTHAQMLIKNADLAMYRVKHSFRNGYSFFSNELLESSDKRAKIEKALRNAILRDEFEVYYQPLVSISGDILGAEALLRWQNPDLGWVSPVDFIPVAEESGLILSIGDWVIEQACMLLKTLMLSESSAEPKYVSVNISPRQFVQPQFTQTLLGILDKHGVPHNKLRLEITENVAIDNITHTIDIMQQLNEKGICIMLDDFGSGYSSLSYLHKLPLKTIKVDRSFISEIDSSKDNQVITCSIIDICEHFSMECIVEGLETQAELAFLSDKAVTAFQGYYFHKPMPKSAFLGLFSAT